MGAEDQQSPGEKCRDCGNDISGAIAAGESVCPNCGCYFRTPVTINRRRIWGLFWAVFLGTPVLTLVSLRSGQGFLLLIAGAFVAGGILSRLFTKDSSVDILKSILFGVLVLVVYVGIAFAGCLVVMSGMRGL